MPAGTLIATEAICAARILTSLKFIGFVSSMRRRWRKGGAEASEALALHPCLIVLVELSIRMKETERQRDRDRESERA